MPAIKWVTGSLYVANTVFPVLQVRAFAYQDAQRYRLGANFIQLPVNRPKNSFNPLRRDGAANSQGLGGSAPYYPSSFQDLGTARQYASAAAENWSGRVVDFESKMTEEDFVQPREFWERILPKDRGQQENLVSNVAEHLAQALPSVREKTYCTLFCLPILVFQLLLPLPTLRAPPVELPFHFFGVECSVVFSSFSLLLARLGLTINSPHSPLPPRPPGSRSQDPPGH